MPAALDRAERDRIDHQPRLQTRLDDEQPADFLEHAYPVKRLSDERARRGFEPFFPQRKWLIRY
jgi:hypothetical protein